MAVKMTETEARTRLAEGRLYDPGQEGILEEQRRRMEILYDYNATRPSETGRRAELLGKMLAEEKTAISSRRFTPISAADTCISGTMCMQISISPWWMTLMSTWATTCRSGRM